MIRNQVLLFDEGNTIHMCLSDMGAKGNILLAQNLDEAQQILNFPEYNQDGNSLWKVIVIGREGGLESKAKILIEGIRRKFPRPMEVPILLVTQTSEEHARKIERSLGGKAEIFRLDPDVDVDLSQTAAMLSNPEFHPQTPGSPLHTATVSLNCLGVEKFDALVTALGKWVRKTPETGEFYIRNR